MSLRAGLPRPRLALLRLHCAAVRGGGGGGGTEVWAAHHLPPPAPTLPRLSSPGRVLLQCYNPVSAGSNYDDEDLRQMTRI